jgi:hypothetical protein
MHAEHRDSNIIGKWMGLAAAQGVKAYDSVKTMFGQQIRGLERLKEDALAFLKQMAKRTCPREILPCIVAIQVLDFLSYLTDFLG